MKALITGASSGIGKEFAYQLASQNYDLILVARREENLKQIQKEIIEKYHVQVEYHAYDLKQLENCQKIAENLENVEVFINNAGFGDSGEFIVTDLEKEMEMIDLNIKAMHYLLKKIVQFFAKQNHGYILNVASLAAFQPGPKMATYYATKAYVLHLSEAISFELRKSNVTVTALCPGPVATQFNQVANVKFHVKELSPEKVVRVALKGMWKKKTIVIPSFKERLGVFLERFISRKMQKRIIGKVQDKKQGIK